MNLTQFSARACAAFLRELADDGAPVPVDAMNAVVLLDSVMAADPAQTLRPSSDPVALMTADPAAFANAIRAEALWMVVGPRAGDAAVTVTDAVMKAAVALTAEHADDLLDHYRPTFTRAASVITSAVRAGVRHDMRAEDLVNGGPAVVAAWQPVPAAAHVLDGIASKRRRMSELLGVAPLDPDARDVAFARTRLPAATNRSGAAYWLHLASYGHLALHTVAQTVAAERVTRPPIRVTVIERGDRLGMNINRSGPGGGDPPTPTARTAGHRASLSV